MPCSCGDSKCSCTEKCICLSIFCTCIICLQNEGKVTKNESKREPIDPPSVTKIHSLHEIVENKASCSDSSADINNKSSTTQSQDLTEVSVADESDCEVVFIKFRNPKSKLNSRAKYSKTENTHIEVIDLCQLEMINLSADNETDGKIGFEKLERSVDQVHRDDMGKEHTAGTVNTLPNALKDQESSFKQVKNISGEGSSADGNKRDINSDPESLDSSTNLQPQKKLRLTDTENTDLPISVDFKVESQPDSTVPELLNSDDPKDENNADTATDESKQSIEKSILNTLSEILPVTSVEESVKSENKLPVLLNNDTDVSAIPSKKDEDGNKVSNFEQCVTFAKSNNDTDDSVIHSKKDEGGNEVSNYGQSVTYAKSNDTDDSVINSKKDEDGNEVSNYGQSVTYAKSNDTDDSAIHSKKDEDGNKVSNYEQSVAFAKSNNDTDDSVIHSKKDEGGNEVSNYEQSVTYAKSGTQTALHDRRRNRSWYRSSYNRHQLCPVWRNSPRSATPRPFVHSHAVCGWNWQQNWTHAMQPWHRGFNFHGNQRRFIWSGKYMHQPSMNQQRYRNKKNNFKSNWIYASKYTWSAAGASIPNVSHTSKPNVEPISKPNDSSTSTLTFSSKVTLNVESKATLTDVSSSALIVTSTSTVSVTSNTTLEDVSSSTPTVDSKLTSTDSEVLANNDDSESNDAFTACVKQEIQEEEEYVPITIKTDHVPITIKTEPESTDDEQENVFLKKEIKQEVI